MGCGCDCAPAAPARRRILVEMFYVDIDTCTRCRGTGDSLDRALAAARPALEALEVEVEVSRTLVDGPEQAEAVRLETSPTIRVDGRDIQPDPEESQCESCGDLMTEGAVDCRVWTWRGSRHTEPPAGLIVEALLKAALSPPAEARPPYALPDNLRRFFANRRR